jgi:putative cell wall-binding protein
LLHTDRWLVRWLAVVVAISSVIVAAPAVAGAAADAREPAAHLPGSRYGDPCEGAAATDLHDLTIDELFEDDRRTVRRGDVRVEARFCAPVPAASIGTVRVDLHPRNDGPEGPDYSETPGRVLTISWQGDGFAWRLRDDTGTVVSGVARARGDVDAVTSVVADVPACAIAAASGTSCAGDRTLPDRAPGPLPPLAIRACTADVDCGPAYRTVGGATQGDPTPQRSDVDYLPEPRYYQLTYPSVCQVGGVSRVPLRTAPTELLATPAAAAALRGHGFSHVGELPDGRVRLRGDVDHARELVADAAVEPVLLRRQQAVPDDPYYSDDGPAAPTGQWSLARVGLEAARDLTHGDGTRVAIIDSGFDGRHPDLRGRAVAVRDFVATRDGGTGGLLDRDADTDLNGHGTFVASTVAAATDNGAGMAALASGTRLLVARVFDAEGCASDGAVVDAMSWAASSGADAVNLSLGGPGTSPPLRQAGLEVAALGAVPVAAAGNSGGSRLEYPAAYDTFLSVAATGYIAADRPGQDPVAVYSTGNPEVDIAAPGGSNASTAPAQDILGACWVGPTAGRGYCRESGTSFAAPLVSAGVALARSLDPDRTPVGVRQLLTDTARDITEAPGTGPGRDDRTGAGRLDVGRATRLLAGRTDTLDSISGSGDATTVSVAASRAAFPDGSARHVVLARNDVFADSLAGAALAGESGPILMTPPTRLTPSVEAELSRVLPAGDRVWILGGESAVSTAVVDRVRALGYSPIRLHGRTRIGTATAIARQVGPHPSGQVLVASAANWPDAIAGGLYAADRGVPLVLSWPDSAADTRSPGVVAAVDALGGRDIVLLGGEAALSREVAGALRSVGPTRRISGPSRFATATAVARLLWGRSGYAPDQSFTIVNGDRANGWAMGLAAAPLAARGDAPLLLVNDALSTVEPARYLRDGLRYRLDRPATGLVVGSILNDGPPAVRQFTAQRLRELLGG